jgi:hypothetical protein
MQLWSGVGLGAQGFDETSAFGNAGNPAIPKKPLLVNKLADRIQVDS